HAVGVNGAVLAFTAALSMATGIVFGLAPAVQGSGVDLNQVMRESTRSATAGGHAARLRAVFVVAEFALALVLLVGAALLVQSFWRLQRVELGFDPHSVLTARLWLPQPNDPKTGPYFTHEARVAFYRQVLERVASLPGVTVASGVSSLPLDGPRGRLSFAIEGRPTDQGDTPSAEAALATPGYFRALGIDLVRGRLFDDHDDAKARTVAIVSETFARTFFPGEDAIGRRIGPGLRGRPGIGPLQAAATNWLTIVGVVRNVKTRTLETEPAPVVYRSVL